MQIARPICISSILSTVYHYTHTHTHISISTDSEVLFIQRYIDTHKKGEETGAERLTMKIDTTDWKKGGE